MRILFNEQFDHGSIICHLINSFFGFGVAGEAHTGCNDEYTIRYTCYNIKVYLGPIVININFELFPKKIDIDRLFHNESYRNESSECSSSSAQ